MNTQTEQYHRRNCLNKPGKKSTTNVYICACEKKNKKCNFALYNNSLHQKDRNRTLVFEFILIKSAYILY